MMELVLLGLRNKSTNELSILDTSNHKSLDIKENVTYPVHPHPLAYISSVSNKGLFKNYELTYLLVETNISEEEMESTRSGARMSQIFKDKNVKVISEYFKPFENALYMLKKYPEQIGTYDLTTWVIHQETRTKDEYNAMCEILKIAAEDKESQKYILDISLDKYTLPYVSFLLSLKGRKVTFGRHGTNSLTAKELDNVTLTKESFLYLLDNITYNDFLFQHEFFNTEFYKENIDGTSIGNNFIDSLYDTKIAKISKSKLDIDFIFSRLYNKTMYKSNYFDSSYETPIELVTAKNYKLVKQTYNPYDYYCCEDCDGHPLSESDTAYDYFVDEQVDFLTSLIDAWYPYLSEKSCPLFKLWDKNIFVKYLETNPADNFALKTLNFLNNQTV